MTIYITNIESTQKPFTRLESKVKNTLFLLKRPVSDYTFSLAEFENSILFVRLKNENYRPCGPTKEALMCINNMIETLIMKKTCL